LSLSDELVLEQGDQNHILSDLNHTCFLYKLVAETHN